jgi:hypothetical protein
MTPPELFLYRQSETLSRDWGGPVSNPRSNDNINHKQKDTRKEIFPVVALPS